MSSTVDTPVLLENRCYDELQVGDSASLTRVLTKDDIELFAILSGDVNPAHLDEAYARDTPFHKVIAHGMWGGTLISTVLGTKLPGPGTIYVGQQLRFVRPVGLGDVITVTVTVKEKRDKNMVLLDCLCSNQQGKPVITGEAEVMAPSVKVQREAQPLPELHLHRHERFAQLMAMTQSMARIRCAIVYPDSVDSLMVALDAARCGLIQPLLIGPRARLETLAQAHGLDLSGCEWEDASSPTSALWQAVSLAREGDVAAIMQGDIGREALLQTITSREGGLLQHRALTHAYVADVPDYPRPFIVTDAAIHVQPTLETKRDIVQNAIDLARVLGFDEPRVAILSAADAVTSALSSSMDAAALCKMAERHQIAGGLVDGPLSFDAAINPDVARRKNPDSAVAGQANVLLVPNLETGDMLIKQLSFLADADVASIVLGSPVPVILIDKADKPRTRVASTALAVLLSAAQDRLEPVAHLQ
ncbi:MAG: bifunctional enoyl-CoA hydratase/phosphate acetyltransferase [Aquabacterium sp.]|nr:bifunctional enoyl-CoA hydratase/phosphate acetyltransferase [Aquabacterium sp.]